MTDRKNQRVNMTDDDICGCEDTTTGHPCKNPSSRPDGRCHVHTEIGEVADVGRNTKLTMERQESIAQLIEDGHSIAAACRCNGISQQTFYRWLEKGDDQDDGIYREFSERVARARGAGERRLVDDLLEMAREEGDTRSLLSVLKNRYPESWGSSDDEDTRQETVEVYLTADKD